MAAGKAHYSGLILPFVVLGAAAGLARARSRPALSLVLSAALVLGGLVAFVSEGAGPLGGNYAPSTVTAHAQTAWSLANGLPPDATVSASASLVPHLSRRARLYVFPAVLDAEYVILDLRASPAPTSAGDVFLRVRSLLGEGGWAIEHADDGLIVLHRDPAAPPTDMAVFARILASSATGSTTTVPLGTYFEERLSLMAAELVPAPDGAIDVDGPHGILRTVWRAEQPLPSGTRLDFWISLRDAAPVHVWDVAGLWWNPPETWAPGQLVTIDVPDVPTRRFVSWQATVS